MTLTCMFCEVVIPLKDGVFFPPPGTKALTDGRVYGPCCRDLGEDLDWVMAE
jgi:hypothetical protein